MLIADLHIHSKYSRATSRELTPERLALWAARKGIGVLGTGDFTHAAWRKELTEALEPAEEGLYRLKAPLPSQAPGHAPRFIVSGEISSIYKKGGRTRKVHNLILLPSLEAAQALSLRLEGMGANLHSDGRPILGLDSRDLLEMTLEVCPEAVFIPAHIWTPHFSLFGAYSGFETMEECFEDLTPHIRALETGLSSNPPMNWRLSALDGYTLVSNSDAHSPANLGREANLMDCALSYPAIAQAIQGGAEKGFRGTIEFFPEEGKYHFDGHRNCKVCLSPAQTQQAGGVCPVCDRRLTVGVSHRVEELADRPEGFTPQSALPFESLAPLSEVVAASLGMSAGGVRVKARVEELVLRLGPEFYILREAPLEDIARQAGPCVSEGVRRLRLGQVELSPGYDGEYGVISILAPEEIERLSGQTSLLPGETGPCKRRPPAAPQRLEAARELTPAPEKPMAAGLNPGQQEAARATARRLAVIAGPGAGKTRTLVERIVYLLQEGGARPGQIAAVTFTNKAAKELRQRLEAQLNGLRGLRAMTVGTFHAICLNRLTQRGQRVHLVDDGEALQLMTEALKGLQVKGAAREWLSRISLVKNGAKHADGAVKEVLDAYQAQLDSAGAADYDDLLLQGLAEAETGAWTFPYLLVDEFQDINPLQYRLVRAWARGGALTVIGDPDQAIYGFRGADAACFDRFLQDEPQAQLVRLTENYRSTPQLLRCALSVMEADGTPRHLVARQPGGERVRLLDADAGFAEALFVVKEIGRLVGGIDMLAAGVQGEERARSFSDMAVLYRTHRQAELLEQCLAKDGIPYRVAGREDFLSDPAVRQAVAFLRFTQDPGDLLALRGWLQGAGLAQAENLANQYAAGEPGLAGLAALLDQAGEAACGLAQTVRHMAALRKPKPDKWVAAWMEANSLTDSPPLDHLLRMAVLQESLEELLRNLLLGQEGDVARSGSRKQAPDAVSLMTLHGAKGLEFPVVFLMGLKDGVVPYRRQGRETDMNEERRLLYVGMTRARDLLYLLAAQPASPFLSAISQDELERLRPQRRPMEGKQLSLFE